jgi:hypothetical protein
VPASRTLKRRFHAATVQDLLRYNTIVVSVIHQKPPGFDVERCRQAADIVDRNFPLRTFHSTDIGTMDPALMRERVLAEMEFMLASAQVLGENIAKRALVGAFHPPKSACCIF